MSLRTLSSPRADSRLDAPLPTERALRDDDRAVEAELRAEPRADSRAEDVMAERSSATVSRADPEPLRALPPRALPRALTSGPRALFPRAVVSPLALRALLRAEGVACGQATSEEKKAFRFEAREKVRICLIKWYLPIYHPRLSLCSDSIQQM